MSDNNMSDQHSCSYYIDSHAHLQDPAYDDDREDVLEKVRGELLSFAWVGYDIESSQKALQLRHPQEPVAVGVHPITLLVPWMFLSNMRICTKKPTRW